MLIFSLFLFWSLLVSTLFLTLIIIGENLCVKYPESIFTKWWKKNIVTEIDSKYDDF